MIIKSELHQKKWGSGWTLLYWIQGRHGSEASGRIESAEFHLIELIIAFAQVLFFFY